MNTKHFKHKMSESQSQDGDRAGRGEVELVWSAARIRGKHAQHSSSSLYGLTLTHTAGETE